MMVPPRRPRRCIQVVTAAMLLAGCTAESGAPAPADSATAAPTEAAPVASPSASGSPSAAPPATTPDPEPVLGPFDGRGALDFATSLASLGPRHAGTEGDEAARRRIAAAFVSAGWTLVREDVPLPQGGSTQNLYAVRDRSHLDAPHVVVGGHHDTIGNSPGANDNASGIAVLVELARELDDEADDLPVPVVLVAFGAEEFQPSTPRVHHLGSEQYAEARADIVAGAFIVDMVGNGPGTRLVWLDGAPDDMARRMQAVADAEGVGPVERQARGDISDHGPFALRGLPAAFLWSGPDGRLHTPADTSDHLDLASLQRAGDLALAFVRGLGAADLPRVRATLD